ncbi:hypothetical protein KCU81_g2066, partial [Aureobasidium melanogenum]|uniref:Uncharacterized protein n=1 Tax=Aureobasidium melanogenum (strain CBS 110374) TaxID=1043003 RepID=A0A074VSI2_AURM1
MSHFRINALQRRFEGELARQRKTNQLQEARWTDFENGARLSLQWMEDFQKEQDELNSDHAYRIQELEKRCAHLGSLIDTGVDDRVVADGALEERIEALENQLGIERDEEESSPSSRYSASAQGIDRFTSLEQEVERMKRRFEAQAHELKALRAQINTQLSGPSAQSYEVNEEIDCAKSSTKKRKVMETNDRQNSANIRPRPTKEDVTTSVGSSEKRKVVNSKDRAESTRVGLSGVWTSTLKLLTETEDGLVPVGSGPLVDAWDQQCNIWSRTDPNWQNYKPSHTCLNSMLWFQFGNVMENPEALSFACSDCESSQTFCVVFDNEKKLLKLLPRRNAPRSAAYQLVNLTTFINPIQRQIN